MTQTINAPVSVSAYYFAGRDMRTFPREIEFGGGSVTFMSGLRYLVQRGADAVRLFDMSASDGLVYRLQQTGDSWTLIGTKAGAL